MADRTHINYWVTFDREPTSAERDAVLAIVKAHQPLEENVSCHHDAERGLWDLGGFYSEGIPDEADQIADALHDRFPDAVEVRCWSDPAYEYLGSVTVYRRGHEIFTAPCDSEGSVVVYAYQLRSMLDEARRGHSWWPLGVQLERLIGPC